MKAYIDIEYDEITEKGTRQKLMEILVDRTNLDKSFLTKCFEDLSGEELDCLFLNFEENYRKIKDCFETEGIKTMSSFKELKTRKLGKCGMTVDTYKKHLIERLGIKKRNDILKTTDSAIIQLLMMKIKKENILNILAYIDTKTLLKKIKTYNQQEIQNFYNIITNIQDVEKVVVFTKKIFGQYNNILKDYKADDIIHIVNNLNKEDISEFFNVYKYGDKHFKIIDMINNKEKFLIIYEDFHNHIIKKFNGFNKAFKIPPIDDEDGKHKGYSIEKSGIKTKEKNKRGNMIFFHICNTIPIEKLCLLIDRTIPFELSERLQKNIDPKIPFEQTKTVIQEKISFIEDIEQTIIYINKTERVKKNEDKKKLLT